MAYPAGAVEIPAEAVDEEFIGRLSLLLRRLGAGEPARRIASPMECAYCPITTADCPERIAKGGLQAGTTSDFQGYLRQRHVAPKMRQPR